MDWLGREAVLRRLGCGVASTCFGTFAVGGQDWLGKRGSCRMLRPPVGLQRLVAVAVLVHAAST